MIILRMSGYQGMDSMFSACSGSLFKLCPYRQERLWVRWDLRTVGPKDSLTVDGSRVWVYF